MITPPPPPHPNKDYRKTVNTSCYQHVLQWPPPLHPHHYLFLPPPHPLLPFSPPPPTTSSPNAIFSSSYYSHLMYQTHKYSFFQFLQPRTQAFFFFSSMLEENESAPVLTLRKANLSLFLSNSSCWFFSRASALHKPQHTPSQQTVTTHNCHSKPSQQTVSLHKLHAQSYCSVIATTTKHVTARPLETPSPPNHNATEAGPLSTGDYKCCIHGWWYATEGKIYVFYYRHVNSPQKNRAFRNTLQPTFAK